MYVFFVDFDLNFAEHHAHLVKFLSPLVAVKWRRIGCAFNLESGVLESIAITIEPGNRDPEDCFSDMLTQWLTRDVTMHNKPTLRGLCTALCDDSVGEERLGISLENAMRNIQG